jgi:hypothetical protein
MRDRTKHVFLQKEEYDDGWVHGLYDAKPDDGAFYGNPAKPVLMGIDPRASRSYREGYRDGEATRVGCELARLLETRR